ncbi:hypothetical protein ACOSQ2_012122 [Xanthoceras sorbifolium]
MYCKDWWKALREDNVSKMISVKLITWKPPCEGCIKLNIDGSVRNCDRSIAADGAFRRYDMSWVGGFIVKIGVGSIFEAELWGLLEGLRYAWTAGIKDLIVESDSLEVVNLVNGVLSPNHPYFNIAQECILLLAADWKCSINHVYREANRLADGLAVLGHDLVLGTHFLDSMPTQIDVLFDEDCRQIAVARLVPG